MGDFNHAVDSREIQQFLTSTQLHNIHQTLNPEYSSNNPTHDRGSETIDAIFATPGIQATRGGFLEFKTFPTDHRAIWCDISFHSIFGHIPPNITPPMRRILKCEDPRVVKKFCKVYHQLLEKNRLYEVANKLSRSIKGSLTLEQQNLYEVIDKQRVRCALLAEKKCRKFKMGDVEFPPKMQHQRDRISLWTAV